MRPRPILASQNGEDHLILAAFDGQSRGFFIDVGAFDGFHLSNTWALEQMGWSGICVEPSPKVFPLLANNRPLSVCIEAAAGAEPGTASLFMDPTMLLSSLGPEESVRSAYKDAANLRGLESEAFTTVDVRLVTLNDLLRRSRWRGPIDVLSIDVEGAEEQVLDGLDLATYRPRLMVIEANDKRSEVSLENRLGALGYSLCRSLRRNLFFAEEKEIASRLKTIDVNCFIPRNLHPFGLDHTHPNQRSDRVILHGRGFPIDELADSYNPLKSTSGTKVPSRDEEE